MTAALAFPGGEYPPEAYAREGRTSEYRLWWELTVTPNMPRLEFGAEQKLSAWLAFNLSEGDTFRISDLRRALGDEIVPNQDEHLNRRFRELRKDGWEVPSNKDDRSLPPGVYRLEAKGWHPALGKRPPRNTVSQGLARRVKDRDKWRCKPCGIGSGEPYPDGSGLAVITVGHIRSREAGGSSRDIDNLRAECKQCNEPVRDEMRVPETADELLPDVRRLRKDELRRLAAWLEQGFRGRDRLDDVYDRARMMRPDDQVEVQRKVRQIIGLDD